MIVNKLENLQIQGGNNHEHCNQDANESNRLRARIQELETSEVQKRKETEDHKLNNIRE